MKSLPLNGSMVKAQLHPLETEIQSGHFDAGGTRLAAVEREAKAKGFALIACKAAAARKEKMTSHAAADPR